MKAGLDILRADAAAAALSVLGFGLMLWLLPDGSPQSVPDSHEYLAFAAELAEGIVLTEGLRLPLYPALLMLLDPVSETFGIGLSAAQAACIGLTAMAGHRIVGRFGLPRLPAAILLAINPLSWAMAACILPDVLFAACIAGGAWLCMRAADVRRDWVFAALGAGLVFGAAALIRHNGPVFAVVAVVACAGYAVLGRPRLRRLAAGLIPAAVCAATVGAWLAVEAEAGGPARYSEPRYGMIGAYDNAAELEQVLGGGTIEEARVRVAADFATRYGTDPALTVRNFEAGNALGPHALGWIAERAREDPEAWALATARSAASTLFSAGAGFWPLVRSQAPFSVGDVLEATTDPSDLATRVRTAAAAADGAGILLAVVSFAYALAIHGAAVLGGVRLLLVGRFGTALLLGGIAVVCLATAAYIGYARYRLPFEIAFVALALALVFPRRPVPDQPAAARPDPVTPSAA